MNDLWLIGAGAMAEEYAKVLKAQGQSFSVIGRGEESAARFTAATGVSVRSGGLADALNQTAAPRTAIVPVGIADLADTTSQLIEAGVDRILVEKPGGIDKHAIKAVIEKAKPRGTDIRVAFNRRFFASVLHAEQIIAADGGATSIFFEFTEWANRIAVHPAPKAVKENWLLANSVHVVDLAFWLAGRPTELFSATRGALSWHPQAAVFVGAGSTESGALFSYHSNWASAGRWGLEVCTPQRRLFLRPMEALAVQVLDSVAIDPVMIDDRLDKEFKPGLYKLTEAFLGADTGRRLPSIKEQFENADTIYETISPATFDDAQTSRLQRF